MTTTIHFGIPRNLLLTANQRMHWRKKAKLTAAIRELAYVQTRTFKATPMQAAHCLVELSWPDKRRRDAHNLMPTIKACIDGIVDANLLPDDSDRHLTGPDLRPAAALIKQDGIAVYLTFHFTPTYTCRTCGKPVTKATGTPDGEANSFWATADRSICREGRFHQAEVTA